MQIIELKNNNFDKQIIKKLLEKKVCLIGVFSKLCIHCNIMKPQWEILKKKLKKTNLNGVLLEIDANQLDYIDYSLLKNSVDGLPSIMVFKRGKKVKEYVGDRTSNDIYKFFKSYLVNKNSKNSVRRRKFIKQINSKARKKPFFRTNKKTKKIRSGS